MSKLADILFKPIGIVVSADKVQIVRPNGDKISCAKECYFFLGDKIVNNSDEDVEVTINGEKVKLEPKESTTVVSIDQKTIDNIALLQKELIKGKSIDELEDTTAGKNLLDSVGAISDIVFIKSGHFSNVHASANDIDFIQNIKEMVLFCLLVVKKKLLVIRNASFFMIKSITHLKYSYAKSVPIKSTTKIDISMDKSIFLMAIKNFKKF